MLQRTRGHRRNGCRGANIWEWRGPEKECFHHIAAVFLETLSERGSGCGWQGRGREGEGRCRLWEQREMQEGPLQGIGSGISRGRGQGEVSHRAP